MFEDTDSVAACSSQKFSNSNSLECFRTTFFLKLGPKRGFLVTTDMNVQSVSKKSSADAKASFKDPKERS